MPVRLANLSAALGLLLAAAAPAGAAEIALANAWLRPASAGQADAAVYLDIRSDRALKLVGATTGAAKRVELVVVDAPGQQGASGRVVPELPIAANAETRLPYLGNHLRLREIGRDLRPGDRVGLELTFAEAGGRRQTIATEAIVRGIAVRRPDGADPEPPVPAASPAGTPPAR